MNPTPHKEKLIESIEEMARILWRRKEYDSEIEAEQGLKDFIARHEAQLREEMREKQDKNIGMLRQALNEDRITDPQKMVTDEYIKHWLDL